MNIRLPDCLARSDLGQALRYLQIYYGQPYTGAYFDTWASAGSDPERITADDLVAVSFLSVVVPPMAARELLDTRADEFTALLRSVGPDRDLADQAEPVTEDQPGSELYRAILGLYGVGRTIGTKLLARKRPRLFPIYDSVVAKVCGIGNFHWEPLRQVLRSDGLYERLIELRGRAGLGREVSALRVLDVVAWMEGKATGVRPTSPEELLGESLTGLRTADRE
ncbi:DUF6308 family protein [Geodermatophilus ruber]|uniref:Uncharacterized protein n=1 Tax=Geodermatophilus ruber TaxID=504800 RepID=A0A1I4H6D7_9ACTN|nr:DUF6308 family protein [Geodermatophilus ruber]SFL37735.1 hypothetical protein SAMN04488085_11055 [Geodermatophilus ruber]